MLKIQKEQKSKKEAHFVLFSVTENVVKKYLLFVKNAETKKKNGHFLCVAWILARKTLDLYELFAIICALFYQNLTLLD